MSANIKKAFDALSGLRNAQGRLYYIARNCEAVGLELLAEKLTEEALLIERYHDILRDAISNDIAERVKQTEQSTTDASRAMAMAKSSELHDPE